jgi:hypothetical protein
MNHVFHGNLNIQKNNINLARTPQVFARLLRLKKERSGINEQESFANFDFVACYFEPDNAAGVCEC